MRVMQCARMERAKKATWFLLLALVAGIISACGSGSPSSEPEEPGTAGGPPSPTSSLASPVAVVLEIQGVLRRAIVYPNSVPSPQRGAPLVLVFHGHGGTAGSASTAYPFHQLWPEAVVAYLEGIPGVMGITDPEGAKNGWQKNPGELNDRDVEFLDAMLGELRHEYRIDPDRIYAFGHSNGARFVNVLWNVRGETFAALASSSAQGGQLILGNVARSLFMLIGEKDPLVSAASQKLSIPLAQAALQTDPGGARVEGSLRTEPGIMGTELVTYIHSGGHPLPKEAMPLIVSFFQRHTRPP